MGYLSGEKAVVLGAGGAIGSAMVQDLLSTGTVSHICMYDPFEQGVKGAAEEIYHCAYPGAQVTWTTDITEALSGAHYILSSGGAPRKEGMTREDLLRGNCEIARQLGQDIRRCCPEVEFVVIIFNPADITGLTTLVHSGLQPGRVSTLAALDSTRLQARLAQHFGVQQDRVTGCKTYGGHGEKMAVFKSGIQIAGTPLTEILNGAQVNSRTMSQAEWEEVQDAVRNGGAAVIKLRGRSSWQSPAHQTVEMLRGYLKQGDYPWPCGAYMKEGEFAGVMMAADVEWSAGGITPLQPEGAEDDMAALRDSFRHLCKLRDEVISAGILPPVAQWGQLNPNL